MDIIEFQNKLKEIQTLALNNGKKVQAVLVERFFDEEGMDPEKMQKVYDYLEIQGIHIEGRKKQKKKEEKETSCREALEQDVPLTAEEEEFLEEYMEALQAPEAEVGEALEQFLRGRNAQKETLIRSFQRDIIALARKWNHKDIFFGELLQEGNMGVLAALDRIEDRKPETAKEAKNWILRETENTMKLYIEEQTQQKKEDDILVEKVRNLEARVKALTEDENIKYSVEELAVFLDMDVEEMEAVLRLTGDGGE